MQKIRIPFDELQKNYIYLFQMRNYYIIALNGKRNFMAPIHPNMEIRRNRVACINELAFIGRIITIQIIIVITN